MRHPKRRGPHPRTINRHTKTKSQIPYNKKRDNPSYTQLKQTKNLAFFHLQQPPLINAFEGIFGNAFPAILSHSLF